MKIITFNPEDWYNGFVSPEQKDWEQFEFRVDKLLPKILEDLKVRNLKATFFCMGWLAEKHPEVVKMIADHGHQIGCNLYQHDDPTTMTEAEFREDLRKSKQLIEAVAGVKCEAFRAPNFAVTDWMWDVLAEEGFKYSSSVVPGREVWYDKAEPAIIETKKGNRIVEFPVSPHYVFGKPIIYSGGGYFRLLPYCLIKRLAQKESYVMVYLHPRDLDKDQPRRKDLSVVCKFLNYYGLKDSYNKWLKLMDVFAYEADNIEDAAKKIDKVIKL